MPKMTNIRPLEVSLVDKPANKREFLTLKAEGEITMESILELIQKTEADNEAELVEKLEEAGLADEAIEAAKVMARVTNGMRDEIGEEEFITIGKAMGLQFEVTEKDEADEDADEDESPVDKSALDEETRKYIDSLEEKVDSVVEESARDGFIEKAEDEFDNLTASAEELGGLLMQAHKSLDEDNVELLERVLKSSNTRLEDGEAEELEKEEGSDGEGTTGDALEKFMSLRDEKFEENDDLETKEAATLKTARENPDLYAKYVQQKS